ncbi:MFS siderophore iron transporter, partial [Apiospora phragmitis]
GQSGWKTNVWHAICSIWFLYLVNAFQSSILSNLVAYATSDFETHSLLNIIYVVASAMTAAVYIPLAKMLDIWGRAEAPKHLLTGHHITGFAIMTVFATLGLILMAISHNLPTFCAAYVFYTLGFGGMTFCVDVITADASKLRNRGLAYAFTSSPYIITAFAGSRASEAFYYDVSWRWAFGCFAIVFPVIAAPLFFLLKINLRKARARGNVVKAPSQRSLVQGYGTIPWSLTVIVVIRDTPPALGVVLFSVGLVVFLLPFDIADAAPQGWRSGYIIAMLAVGFTMLLVFVAWETLLAPAPMLNVGLMNNRTVIGACLLDATYQVSYYCWSNCFPFLLQVVNGLSIAEAGYVSHTFDVVSGVPLLVVGFLIRRTDRFKWLLYGAVPLYLLAQGLMIYFRRPDQSVGLLVMCQVLLSVGSSVFIIVEKLAILTAVDHQHVVAALAVLNVVGIVGGALGATVSGAVWTHVFPQVLARFLARFLPPADRPDLDAIYEDLPTQLGYAAGSEARVAIQAAYGYTQTRMLAAGTGVMGLALVWVLLIRNIDLTTAPQVKGMVF